MKSFLYYLFLLLFIPINLKSQVIVQFKDQSSNETIANVQIESINNSWHIGSNYKGNITIPTSFQNDTFKAICLGFSEKIFALPPNQNYLLIELEKDHALMDEIHITTVSSGIKQDFKGSNYVIGSKRLTIAQPIGTEEILKTIPGINILGDIGISNRPNISIRGSWGRRSKKVLMLEDGTPIAPAPYIAPGTYYNPASDRLQSIEVYKGADILKYGPNNMYGAINYITAQPPNQPEARFKLTGGQSKYMTLLGSYGGTWNNLGALFEGVYKSFGGFQENSSVRILNLNSKIFAKINSNQSIYFKVSGQFEENQASLTGITPFTFNVSPYSNPFNADRFSMRRYGLDIVHKWVSESNLSITSKIYASDFQRDWWKQTTEKIRALDAWAYLDSSTINAKFSYLKSHDLGGDDWIIVGKRNNGIESTMDSRWEYTVAGIKESWVKNWNSSNNIRHKLSGEVNYHYESFKDITIIADSSKWARDGRVTSDYWYELFSLNGYAQYTISGEKWSISPILRLEHVNMYKQDLKQLSYNTNLLDDETGKNYNKYFQALPGILGDYKSKLGKFHASIFHGMIAPSKVFGFMVEQNGIIVNPFANSTINMKPELSWNKELVWTSNNSQFANVQIAFFRNDIYNLYAGGRNEVFEQLGRMRVEGAELSLFSKIWHNNNFEFKWNHAFTIMNSKVSSGVLNDKDLFNQVKHSSATKLEFIKLVNENRDAFSIYETDNNGNLVEMSSKELLDSDFSKITKATIDFSNIDRDFQAPYTPNWTYNTTFIFEYNKINFGMTFNYIASQFTEYFNFSNESADGSIGKLPSYTTLDLMGQWELVKSKGKSLIFSINGKNITGSLYKSSRLNRATSGIFPGGFTLWMAGLQVKF